MIPPVSTGTTPARPAAPRPEVEALIPSSTWGAARQKLAAVLATYPAETLRDAKEFGLQIGTAVHPNQLIVGLGERAKGVYLPAERRVLLDAAVLLADDGDALVHHEMGHALDAMRGLERHPLRRLKPVILGPAAPDSVSDPKLGRLYRDYRARNRVEEAVEFRDRLAARYPEGLPERVVQDGVTYERKGATEHVRFAEERRLLPGQLLRAVAAAALIGVGVAVSAPLLGVVGLAVGVATALQGFRTQRVDEAVVQSRPGSTHVAMPAGYTNPPDTSWSDYAHDTGLVQEYLAEGMAALRQADPARREAMRTHDPAFAEHLTDIISHEG